MAGGLRLINSLHAYPGEDVLANAKADQNYLFACKNLDVTNEGLLTARSGCRRADNTSTIYTDATRECLVLGSVLEKESIRPVLGIYLSGTNQTKIYLTYDGSTDSMQYWGILTGRITSIQKYNNTIYLTRSDADSGYSIPNSFFVMTAYVTAETAVTVSTMPRGDKSFVFKDRLFIINRETSLINFSAPTDFTDWTVDSGGGYFIVDPSNESGQQILDVVVTQETFYIFKRRQTYLFGYDANPNDDGVLRLINSALGAFSATVWQNDIYVVNTDGVYKIVNGVFIQVDQALNLKENAQLSMVIDPREVAYGGYANPIFIHAAADKLLVGMLSDEFQENFGGYYVSMNLNNGAWSVYEYIDEEINGFNYIAPGSAGVDCQPPNTWGNTLYANPTKKYFVRINNSRGSRGYTYDGMTTGDGLYVPEVRVQTFPWDAGIGNVFKKLHRIATSAMYYQYNSVGTLDFTLAIAFDGIYGSTYDYTSNVDDSPFIDRLGVLPSVGIPFTQQRFRSINFIWISNKSTSPLTPSEVGITSPRYDIVIGQVDMDISVPRGRSPI